MKSDPRSDHLRSLRVGCVKYVNARLLINGWPHPVKFDHPAALCMQLARRDLDVALVSSFEFLRNPIYQIVDGISISSDGSVYSVVVAHLGDISEVEEIELDPASETSANLLRCLLAESGRVPPLLTRSTSPITKRRGRLLIGDQAIRFRQQQATKFNFWDLGERWKKLVDLPFVYALWLIRPEVLDSKTVANRLRALRDANLADIDRILENEEEFGSTFCSRYYREHLQFSFGEKEKGGLRAFAQLCTKHALLPNSDFSLNLV